MGQLIALQRQFLCHAGLGDEAAIHSEQNQLPRTQRVVTCTELLDITETLSECVKGKS